MENKRDDTTVSSTVRTQQSTPSVGDKYAGNVVIGYTSSTFLMIDVDTGERKRVLDFAKQYTKKYRLGSVLVLLTSVDPQTDLSGNKLGKYAIIFGKPIAYAEVQWHINEARRLGMCERKFLVMRKLSYVTIRANAKNRKTPYPEIAAFIPNGDCTGIKHYMEIWRNSKHLGSIPLPPDAETFYRGNPSLVKRSKVSNQKKKRREKWRKRCELKGVKMCV